MSWSERPLVLFAACFSVGMAAVVLLVWFDASDMLTLPGWLGREGTTVIVGGTLSAALAALLAGIRTWRGVVTASLAAAALHFVIYYLPLLVLLELQVTVFALVSLGWIALGLIVLYGAVLTAMSFANAIRKKGKAT